MSKKRRRLFKICRACSQERREPIQNLDSSLLLIEEGAYQKFGQRLTLKDIRITPCSERSKELNQNLHSGFLLREEKAYLIFG